MIRAVILVFAIFSLFASICGEILSYRPCQQSSTDLCQVKNVTATCPVVDEVCRLKRGKNATIVIEYTPGFEAEKLTSRAFWANGFIDLPLMGMETNACLTTKCPVAKGDTELYTYNLFVSKNYPTGTYDVKWRIYNEEDSSKECCFLFKLKLLR